MKLRLSFLFMLFCFLLACSGGENPKTKVQKSYQVKKVPLNKSLHFTGTIQPLKESSLSSPVDAVVETMNYHYGQMIKKGEVVLSLNSSELQKQYNETLTEYLKAKDSFAVANAKFTGTQDLWNSGLLAKNNYLGEKSNLDNARITLMQASRKLAEMLEKMDEGSAPDLTHLSLAEFDKVREALAIRHNIIHLKAPEAGIFLYPPKASEDKNTRISVGSTIKAGQVIGLIGNLDGISVEIDVMEIDIDKIHPGIDAVIRGIALGKEELHGKLVAVNAQANNSNGGLPSFTAVVEVNKLNAKQQSLIKIGMSANIELAISSQHQLLIPISAISQQHGQSMVNLQDEKGKSHPQAITTGSAEADKVIVTSGLKEGDILVYG